MSKVRLKLKIFFRENMKLGKPLLLGLLSFLVIFYPQFSYAGDVNPFIQTGVIWNAPILSTDVAKLAKFNIIDTRRFQANDLVGGSWAAIKAINPNSKIYLYQMGSQTSDLQDTYTAENLNSISRYSTSRSHSMGALNINHPEFFALDSSGNRIYDPAYGFLFTTFGNSSFQTYWNEATKTDIFDQVWVADGIFVDNCTADKAGSGANPIGGAYPALYPNYTAWNTAMNNFVNGITAATHTEGQLIFVNRGNTRSADGAAAWLALDASANPPDIAMEEGAFVIKYGLGDAQFLPEADWKRQVDTVQSLQNTKSALLSHSDLTLTNQTGLDNYGCTVTFYQVLWYAMCSYHLARHDAPNNAYFMFQNSYSTPSLISWFDEYDKINLGPAMSNYTVSAFGGVNVYRREFARGYVFVNPTNSNAVAVTVPVQSRQLTHENINSDPLSLPLVSTVNVPAHNGVIMLKNIENVSPAPPSGLRVQ